MLAVTHLQAVRDDRVLFSQLDFSLHPSEMLQIVGPNGTGKTTLLHGLMGLAPLSAGEIFWQQQSIQESPHLFRQNVSFLGHLLGLKMLLNPIENLVFLLQLRQKKVSPNTIEHALAKVGLAGYEDVPIANLSAGQKRRVALARLFLEQSPLWILDEPFTAIDLAGVQALEGWLQQHCQQGGMVLLTTHHVFTAGVPVRQLDLSQFAERS
ncbi:cytochrome c biogenesis heme-transporting ATPase CcmA [Agitococcus lubricus]|uniref:cytochrome c biogenesis heme-transporting ATPase CcmA n=1 Tax=Agitococcus lubricus TaxID=1077255 RepID=UPI000D326D01|nr:cytochrome c biogenesis heme-transporting ATPase CcmA [Agitococcus lubricus]